MDKETYYQKNKERIRQYYQVNREKLIDYSKKWFQSHKEQCYERRRRTRKKSDDKTKNRYKEAWLKIILDRGMNKCFLCGDSAKIHFHHPLDKRWSIAHLKRLPVTPERIQELSKTTPLCISCHARYHYKGNKNFRESNRNERHDSFGRFTSYKTERR